MRKKISDDIIHSKKFNLNMRAVMWFMGTFLFVSMVEADPGFKYEEEASPTPASVNPGYYFTNAITEYQEKWITYNGINVNLPDIGNEISPTFPAFTIKEPPYTFEARIQNLSYAYAARFVKLHDIRKKESNGTKDVDLEVVFTLPILYGYAKISTTGEMNEFKSQLNNANLTLSFDSMRVRMSAKAQKFSERPGIPPKHMRLLNNTKVDSILFYCVELTVSGTGEPPEIESQYGNHLKFQGQEMVHQLRMHVLNNCQPYFVRLLEKLFAWIEYTR